MIIRFRAGRGQPNNLRLRAYTVDRASLLGTFIAGFTEEAPGSYAVNVGTLAGTSWYMVIEYVDTSEIANDGFASATQGELKNDPCCSPATSSTSSDPADSVSAESIAAAGAGPLSISVDGMTVTQRPITDQIAADRHVSSNSANTPRKAFGLRFARVTPGSAVGE